MKIGIVGLGIVGNACKFGFELLGHEVKVHDLKLKTTIEELGGSTIVFVCVPTPSKPDGSCDTSVVESVVEEISRFSFPPIVAIKSTVTPGTTKKLKMKYPNINFAFVPEFLKERSATIDFTERHDLCIIGTPEEYVYNKIKEAHGKLPQNFVWLQNTTAAELCKYFNNSFGAMLTVFANSFYEICAKHWVLYSQVKDAMTKRDFIPDQYLECNDKWRGYAGVCWSKDLPALDKIAEGTGVEFFKHIIEENEKYIKTVPPGMRMKE